MTPQASQTIDLKIKAAKLVSRFSQEARLGLALDSASDYAKIARSMGFVERDAWSIAQRAMVASESQLGNAPKMTWQQDAKWTKF